MRILVFTSIAVWIHSSVVTRFGGGFQQRSRISFVRSTVVWPGDKTLFWTDKSNFTQKNSILIDSE
jgi:hypothetical protein